MPTKIATQQTRRAATQPRRTTRPARPRAKKAGPSTALIARQPGVPRALVDSICGLSDPFCSHARGAKYPDDSSFRTLPFTRHIRTSIITDSTGIAHWMFCPQFYYDPYTTAATSSGPTVTSWNNFGGTAPISTVSSYRIVSCGFVLRNMAPPLTSSGMVRVRSYPIDDLVDFGQVDTSSYNNNASLDVPLQHLSETAVVLQHTSQMPQATYIVNTDTSPVTDTVCRGFAPVTVHLTGCPATLDTVDVEIFINYEIMLEDSNALQQLATPSPPANSILTGAASTVTSTMQPFFADGLKSLSQAIVARATRAVLATAAPVLSRALTLLH